MSQSVERAIELVRRTSERPLSLTEAAGALGVHKSTALRILQTLEANRFVRKTESGFYVLGNGLIELAQLALGTMDLRRLAGHYLRELQQETGHTVHLAQLSGDEVVYIDKVDSPSLDGVQINSRIGQPVSLYASGVGKMILAHRSDDERARLLRRVALVQHTPTTFATPSALEAELERIRERGWATDDGELHDLVNCVAVPILDASGDVVAALSLTAMKTIAPISVLQDYLPVLLETASTISQDVGYTAPSKQLG